MEPDYKKLYEEEHKKYEETLSRAKGLIDGMKEENVNATKEDIKNLFPGEELEESENERIRKNCIHFLELQKKHHAATFEIEECITWLTSLKDTLAFLEKQIEQEPAESPKFKVGDIITHNKANLIYKVVSVNSTGSYHVENIETGGRIALSYAEQNYHLWTIQDAKDGDILEFSDHGRIVVGIISYVNKVTGKVDVNCLLEGNNFKLGNYYALDTIKPHPATKEQCDFLFTKMKENGYEWDAEDKEVRKIEQETELPNGEDYGIDSLYHAVSILEKTLGEVEGYQSDDGILEHKCAIEAVKRLYEQKATWSENDEEMFGYALDMIEWYSGKNENKSRLVSDWLKSLKEKVQPQPKWNEEDEERLNSIIESYKYLLKDYKACHDVDYIPYDSDTLIRNVVDDVNFLKSLKERVQLQPKQELKKIEQKSVDKVKPKFTSGDYIRYRGENYEIKDIEETKDGFIYNVSIIGKPSDPEEVKTAIGFAAERDIVKVEHHTWSEEDESMYIRTLGILGKCYMGDLPTKVEEELDWLKSLKDRVVPQNTWKPTEEQMKTLENAAREAEYNQRFKEADALWSLDKDLKKL